MGKNRRTYGIVIIAFAGIFFLADIFSVYKVVDFYIHSEKAIGVVTDIKQISEGDSHHESTYRYTIQFFANGGKLYTPSTTWQIGNYEVGDNFLVTYDKRNPLNFSTSFWSVWIFVIVCSFGALLFFAIGYAKLHPVSYHVKVRLNRKNLDDL